MKKIFAVALLVGSFAVAAFADGPDLPPPPVKPNTAQVSGLIQLADGPDLPPPPTAGLNLSGFKQLADGPDLPPPPKVAHSSHSSIAV